MSKLLAMMMSGGGGQKKVLNLEPVNGATYDSNYIMTGTTTSDNCPYFITKEKIDLRNTANKIELKMKFMATSTGSGFFKADISQTDWNKFCSCYVSGASQLWVSINGSYGSYSTVSLNSWIWLKITKPANSNYYTVERSIDGITYYNVYSKNADDINEMYMTFGYGASTGSTYGMHGKIDFRETDIKINDQSVLWVEQEQQ